MSKQKSTWGGQREGAGRPPMDKGRRNLVIDASEAEYQKIIKALSTRERTKALLAAIEREKKP